MGSDQMVSVTQEQDQRITDSIEYLRLLSREFPSIDEASTEIINLQAIQNLPKGTEHFLADIHGENEPFEHVLRNASGVIRRNIDIIFGNTLTGSDKKSLATLIYYPEQKLDLVQRTQSDLNDWYKITLYRLIEVCRCFSSKYTRSKVRKAMPPNFTYIIEELLHNDSDRVDKHEYYNEIIHTIIDIDRAREFIVALSKLIQRPRHRSSAHNRRHLRSRARRGQRHGHSYVLSQRRYPVGQPRHIMDGRGRRLGRLHSERT
jgi:fructose-1,6-bisphosphatase-3